MNGQNVVRILRSLILNYPILKDFDIMLSMPIGLVFKDVRHVQTFIRLVSPNPKVITAATNVETAKTIITEANSEGVFIIMQETPYSRKSIKKTDIVEMAFSAAGLSDIDGNPVHAAIFFTFVKRVPEEFSERIFRIQIDEEECGEMEDIFSVVPADDQLSLVKDRIRYFCTEKGRVDVFKAAICFAYPQFSERGRIEEFQQILETAEELVEADQLYDETEQIAVLVSDCFFHYFVEEGGMNRVFKLPKLQEDAERQLESATFITGDRAYLSETLFRQIVTPLLNAIPIGIIKAGLQKMEILEGMAGNYTVKMKYYDKDGKFRRHGMLRFNMTKITQNDQITLYTLLKR